MRLDKGQADEEMEEKTGPTAATVRRQRFTFREKAKQARMFLAVYELMEERRTSTTSTTPSPPSIEPFLLQREITPEEYSKVLKSAFYSQTPLRLRVLPAKDKRRLITITRITQQFHSNQS